MASLSACGGSKNVRTEYRTITETVYEKVEVPAELLRECSEPELDDVETTGDLEQAFGEALISLASCNQDKARIKAWSQE